MRNAAIKTLSGDANITSTLEPALRKYNEEQFTAVKLPGSSGTVIVSPYNRLEDGRYFDVEGKTSWEFDHVTQKAAGMQSYVAESEHDDVMCVVPLPSAGMAGDQLTVGTASRYTNPSANTSPNTTPRPR